MNVLMISWDRTAAMDKKEEILGDFQDRLAIYGKYVSKLFVIAYSLKNMNLRPKQIDDNVFVYPTSSYNPMTFIFDGYRIASKIFNNEKIDIITTQDPLLTGLLGYILKKRYCVPLNVQIHADYLDNKFWLNKSKIAHFLNILGKFIVKRADSIRVVSSKIKNYLEKCLLIPSNKIFIIPVFVNINKFIEYNPLYIIKQKYSDYENIILFVGRLAEQKNIPNLLKAIPNVITKFPKTLFLIVGEGKEIKKLENMIDTFNIKKNVKFEGLVDNNNLLEYYYSCDLLVLPSYYEGWGLVAIEALACGKPVVMTDVGCANEIVINEKTGYVVPINDSKALAQKIIYLLENPELRKEMGKNGKELIKETQDIHKNAYKYRELYEKTIELAKKETR